MKRIKPDHVLAALLLLLLPVDEARADGGIIRWRETQEPFLITIFTSSEPVSEGLVDVSVMVQDRISSEPILDASVELMFTAPPGSVPQPAARTCCQMCSGTKTGTSPSNMTQFTVAATREQASNKLLYAAPIKFSTAGNWRMSAVIARGNDAVKIACAIPVGSPPRRLTGLLPYLALPPLMIALFTINQCLRKPSLEKSTI
jgi:hypothetical protein